MYRFHSALLTVLTCTKVYKTNRAVDTAWYAVRVGEVNNDKIVMTSFLAVKRRQSSWLLSIFIFEDIPPSSSLSPPSCYVLPSFFFLSSTPLNIDFISLIVTGKGPRTDSIWSLFVGINLIHFAVRKGHARGTRGARRGRIINANTMGVPHFATFSVDVSPQETRGSLAVTFQVCCDVRQGKEATPTGDTSDTCDTCITRRADHDFIIYSLYCARQTHVISHVAIIADENRAYSKASDSLWPWLGSSPCAHAQSHPGPQLSSESSVLIQSRSFAWTRHFLSTLFD